MYGIILTIAIIASALIAQKLLQKSLKLESSVFWDMFFWIILGGIIGARIYHVIDLHVYYSQNPTYIFQLWRGGLSIIGAILGGFGAFIVYIKLNKITLEYTLKILDAIAVSLPLGQALGRWGNYFNKELYGKPYSGLGAIYIPKDSRDKLHMDIDYYHPLFIYEAIANFILFIALYFAYNNKTKYSIKNGNLLLIYLLGYSLIRYNLEALRINSWHINGINVARFITLVFVLISTVSLVLYNGKKRNNNKTNTKQQ